MWCIYMHCTFLTGRVYGRFYRLELKKEMVFSGKLAMEIARLVNDEDNSWIFEVQGKNVGYTRNLRG